MRKEKRKRARTLSEGERSVARGGSKRTSNMLMKSSSPVGNQGLNEVVVPHLLITQVVAVAVLLQVLTSIKASDQTLEMSIARQQMRQTNHSMTITTITILSMNSTGKTLMWT